MHAICGSPNFDVNRSGPGSAAHCTVHAPAIFVNVFLLNKVSLPTFCYPVLEFWCLVSNLQKSICVQCCKLYLIQSPTSQCPHLAYGAWGIDSTHCMTSGFTCGQLHIVVLPRTVHFCCRLMTFSEYCILHQCCLHGRHMLRTMWTALFSGSRPVAQTTSVHRRNHISHRD